jgi:pyruvate,water dikinase
MVFRALDFEGGLEEEAFGAKASRLARALRAGLPVPSGFALDVDSAARLSPADLDACARAAAALGASVAVRSSAIGEDGAAASFAGQHATLLGVKTDASSLADAIATVVASGSVESAAAYREARGVGGQARVAVLVQALVPAIAAGVLFTEDPRSGEEVDVIEAAWGLGEIVVAGEVIPDGFRMGATVACSRARLATRTSWSPWPPTGPPRERRWRRSVRRHPA